MEETIPALVQAAGQRFGDASAIEDGERRFSFRELAAAGLAAGRAFRAAGLQRGERAAIWAPNYSEWIVAAIGIQSAGGVLVPLNTRLKAGEAAYVLGTSGAKILCTVSDFLGVDYAAEIQKQDLPELEQIITFRGSSAGAQTWEDFLSGGEAVPTATIEAEIAALTGDDLSDILFTSGTTGKPKGVMTAHGQNLKAFECWSGFVGLREGDRYLIVNPFFHAFGYKAGWVSAIMRGATILPQVTFDVPEILARIGPDRITMLPGPPTIYQTILAHPDLEKYDISSLRLAATGAAAIPVELIRQMHDKLGFTTVLTGYGLTETCGVVTMCREGDDAETIATTSGRPVPDVEVRLVDTEGNDVATGEPGEVIVRGYNVMRGYFNNPEETAATIDADGFLHTGDIAVADADFNLRITDRIKDMFIMGGFNCYPAEIENALYDSGLVAQVAVIGVPDKRMGEVGMAFVVPAPGSDISPASVVAWSRENMANYKVPRYVELVDSLPTNASGKVTKFVLRERAEKILDTQE
ncbi:MAG: FadD3 family acyl-CoA ligase [Deltaproteobacteria bacterium]